MFLSSLFTFKYSPTPSIHTLGGGGGGGGGGLGGGHRKWPYVLRECPC